MPDKDDDSLEAYEAEMADVRDPSGFKASENQEGHNGVRIMELLGEASDLLVEYLVKMLNDGKPAISQYILPDGFSIVGAAVDPRTLRFVVQLAADSSPFITITPDTGEPQ